MTSSPHNSLAQASSSYLRSAMHQPIQWHEWGEEAFAAARRENKPMLLDIGAVWCHWCHVMDRESYDDAEVAKIINENFVAVKVDRDERPDIDSRYQIAVSALTGQGGWPLTAFLTPDGKPFYGGTYFPPTDGYGRPSFKRVLLSIAQAYHEKNGDVMEQAEMVESAIAQAESFGKGDDRVSAALAAAIAESAIKMFDERNGGFGTAPKFPHPSALDLVMHEYSRTGNDNLREVFVSTLEKMARGGVYDQLAGGFHRYSVDEHWIVPHFEKMSYDNSELLKNYIHAYQATGEEFFADVARDIVRWMDEWLSDRAHGGFYASQDADYSMDDDGDYFTWTLDEARAALTEEETAVACLHYDIGEIGEMHHNPAKNVLYERADAAEIARRLNLTEARVQELLASAKQKLYAARLQRPTPYVDKTVYVGWNAMCVSAYLEAAKVLDDHSDSRDNARRFALRSLDRLLAQGWVDARGAESKLKATAADEGAESESESNAKSKATAAGEGARSTRGLSTLRHVIAYSDPQAARRETAGVLDDYAFTVIACLDAYEATADMTYFRFAREIADAMVEGFFDRAGGGFFDTRGIARDAARDSARDVPRDSARDSARNPAGFAAGEREGGASAADENESKALGILGTRRKPFQDSPTPAGNSAAVIALLRLYGYTNEASYRELAESTLELYAGVAAKHGLFAATYGLAVARFAEPHTQIVVVGNDSVARDMYKAAVRRFSLNTAVMHLDADKAVAQNLPPVLAETLPQMPGLHKAQSGQAQSHLGQPSSGHSHDGRSFAMLCSGFACQPPVYDVDELARILDARARTAA